MKFSSRAKYGLRVCFLAGLKEDEQVSLSTLVKQTDLSEKYLEQILSKLKKGGILESKRGAGGGYILSRPAKDISLKEILIALEDYLDIDECIVGCGDNYCPNKRVFNEIFEKFDSVFSGVTLKDIVDSHKCR